MSKKQVHFYEEEIEAYLGTEVSVDDCLELIASLVNRETTIKGLRLDIWRSIKEAEMEELNR